MQLRPVKLEIDHEVYEGHCCVAGDGVLRVISRYGSRSVHIGELQLPLEMQAEMVMAEIVAAYCSTAVLGTAEP